ncbi:unnamed protein product [Rotaria sp. Silwood1]|nr:unnamed protein product [Rotaria sp. Silwood1]
MHDYDCERKEIETERIRAFQYHDCSNVCHEKCRPIASYKPEKRIGVYSHHRLSHLYSSSNLTGNNSGSQHRTHLGTFENTSAMVTFFSNKPNIRKTLIKAKANLTIKILNTTFVIPSSSINAPLEGIFKGSSQMTG